MSILLTLFIVFMNSRPIELASKPWYHDYFTIVSSPHQIDDVSHAMIRAEAWRSSVLYGGWYGTWYVDWQKDSAFYYNSKHRMERLGLTRHVMYYDGGEVGDFVLFLNEQGDALYDSWTISSWTGTPSITAHWFGLDAFFNSGNLFPLSNYTYYGLHPFTYPDGTAVSNIYEVTGQRGVSNKIEWNLPGMNQNITDNQAEQSGLADISEKRFDGEYVQNRNGWITSRKMTPDYANPQLRDYQAWEIAYLTREEKPSGWHIDNYGDNNLYRPFQSSLGLWSEHTFKLYMQQNFSNDALNNMGISDIETFDVRKYIQDRRITNLSNDYIAYNAADWKDDLIFKCYIINHVQQAVNFHKAKYDAIKEAAQDVGIECLVSGNAIPVFAGYSLINGWLDVSHFEWQTTLEYEPTRRPMGLPPVARSGYITRLAAAVGRENYSRISLYVPHELSGELHENLYLAQGFEALANRSLMDYGHWFLDKYSPGTPRTAGIFNRFIEQYKYELSRRDFVADIGVVYDQWGDIASLTASRLNVTDFFNEYAGWCDFMADTHRQWRVILSSELTYEKIKHLPVLLLPSALSLSDENYAEIETYLQNGGRVLATGNSGLRHGPEGYLMRRGENPLETFSQYGERFRRITEQPAAQYWLTKDNAAAHEMDILIQWTDFTPALTTDAEIHVGITLSRSLSGEPLSLSLDLNNNHFDVETDSFIATELFEINIQLPPEFSEPLLIEAAEPQQSARALDYSINGQVLTLNISPFEIYQFIQITPEGK